MQESSNRFKALILGDMAVGKSCILIRYERDEFRTDYDMTVGVDYIQKDMFLGGHRMVLRVWDTAGQEKFRSVVTSYLKGLDGIIFAFDVTNARSFSNVTNWVNYFSLHASNINIPKILIGNKIDLAGQRVISHEQGCKLAAQVDMTFFEVSALTGTNIQQAFTHLAEMILKSGLKAQLADSITILPEVIPKTEPSRCCFGSSTVPKSEP
jgi:small GTP-binding protein